MDTGRGLLGRGALAKPNGRSGRSPDRSRVNHDRDLTEAHSISSHILRCWHEWELDGSERHIVLCMETALELRPGAEGFNAKLLDELVSEATDMMHACSSPIDTIRIIPER